VQEQWKSQPYPVKKRAALNAAWWIQENAQRIALTIARCTGKIRTEALATEVLPAALGLRHYARRVPLVCKPKKLRSSSILFFNKQSVQYRAPYGVVGIITPWNYPFGIPVHEVATALLTGNGVVLKVATQCQPVGDLIKEMVSSAGFPEGLFQLAHLPGKVAGSVFLHSGIQKLFFTGSTETGKN
jgi:succinate-semialdehyde dehydrogenase/glutarate-semialdehyde dehydrogenase